jgi:hypothetical protein
MRVIMAAANCSPAVASRSAKYDGDFRVLSSWVLSHSTHKNIPMAVPD